MTIKNQTLEVASDTKLATGVQNYFVPGNVSVIVAGVTLTSAQMGAAIQSRVAAMNASKTARAASQKAVNDTKATLESTQSIVDAVRQIALIMYANQPEVLVAFGVAPRKVPLPLTAAEKVERAAKAAATRLARGTKGPKAKLKVTGAAPTAAPVASATTPHA
jgi:hypothetical protein